MSQWQPIETALKDGTDILAWDGAPCIVHWEPEFSPARWVIQHDGMSAWPTHWMPLPAPPNE